MTSNLPFSALDLSKRDDPHHIIRAITGPRRKYVAVRAPGVVVEVNAQPPEFVMLKFVAY